MVVILHLQSMELPYSSTFGNLIHWRKNISPYKKIWLNQGNMNQVTIIVVKEQTKNRHASLNE